MMVMKKKWMKCDSCKKTITRNSNSQKYCKECYKKKHKKQKRERMKRLRSLGTSSINQHRHEDLDYEEFEIKQEVKRIGFRRQFT